MAAVPHATHPLMHNTQYFLSRSSNFVSSTETLNTLEPRRCDFFDVSQFLDLIRLCI